MVFRTMVRGWGTLSRCAVTYLAYHTISFPTPLKGVIFEVRIWYGKLGILVPLTVYGGWGTPYKPLQGLSVSGTRMT